MHKRHELWIFAELLQEEFVLQHLHGHVSGWASHGPPHRRALTAASAASDCSKRDGGAAGLATESGSCRSVR